MTTVAALPRWHRWLAVLLAIVLLVSCTGCWHVHHDYWGFALSGEYEAWADSQGYLTFYALLNPWWWLGILIMAVDLAISPVTFTADLVRYLSSKRGALPAPWDFDASKRWEK